MELLHVMNGKSWDDGAMVLRQIRRLGMFRPK